MKIGAERLCMPSPSVDQFVNAVKQTVLANRRWVTLSTLMKKNKADLIEHKVIILIKDGFKQVQVPPCGKGSLYIRPLLMGIGPILGLAPAPEYTFLVYASPVGNYFKVWFCLSIGNLFQLILLINHINDLRIVMLIYVYFLTSKQEGLAPLSLYVEDEFHRASRGGVGSVKTISNYSPVSHDSYRIPFFATIFFFFK